MAAGRAARGAAGPEGRSECGGAGGAGQGAEGPAGWLWGRAPVGVPGRAEHLPAGGRRCAGGAEAARVRQR